jgi:hypothetical protein
MSEPKKLPERRFQGEGHFVRAEPGHRVEAFFVNVAETRKGLHDTKRGRRTPPAEARLNREDLIFLLDAKKRDWRKQRATAEDRETVLRIGRKLQQQGLHTGEFAKVSFGISRSTYRKWRKRAESP